MSPLKSYSVFGAALTTFVIAVTMHAGPSAAQAAASTPSSRGAAAPVPAGLAILNRSCTSCHEAAQIKQTRPAADWRPIIDRMRSNGAAISDGDAKVLLDYLTKNYSSGS